MSIDSYKLFLEEFGISEERFFRFGLEQSRFITPEKANDAWEKLKDSIQSKQKVYIRSYGGNGKNTQLYIDFYKAVFGLDVEVHANDQPTKMLEELTNLKKNKNIFNYQVSHVFGRTKNIYAFTAPWNVAFVPKMFDPLTGHEALEKGINKSMFQRLFQQKSYDLHTKSINEFNQILLNRSEGIEEYLQEFKPQSIYSSNEIEKFKQSIKSEFMPISL